MLNHSAVEANIPAADLDRAREYYSEKLGLTPVAEYGGDPDFIVVTGGSAGGHLAAMVALTANDPEYQPGFQDADTSVSGAVPIYGVYDMTETFRYKGTNPRGSRWMEQRVLGRTFDDDPDFFRRSSPVHRVHPDADELKAGGGSMPLFINKRLGMEAIWSPWAFRIAAQDPNVRWRNP